MLPLLWKWGNGATDPYFAYRSQNFPMHCGVTPVSAVLLYWLLVYGGLGRAAAQAALNLGSDIQLLNAISSAPRARYLNE